MRLKLDENITVAAKKPLVAFGHDVETVADEQLTGRPDPDVLVAAATDQRTLVTFDLGFGEPRTHPPRSHRGVILLRLRDQQPANVISVIQRSSRYPVAEEAAVMGFERITVRAGQMGGQPCIRGLRIPVATVVDMVADGMTADEVVAALPDLEPPDVAEALHYAAAALQERLVPLLDRA